MLFRSQQLNGCSGVEFNLNPQNYISNSVTSTYSWKAITVQNFIQGVAVGDVGTGNIIYTLDNLVTVPQAATFSVTSTSTNGCVGTPFNVKVTIFGVPSASASPNGALDLCTGSNRVISGSAFGSNTPFTHSWSIVNQTNATGKLNGTAGPVAVQSPTFVGTLNPGQTSGTVTLRYTATDSKGCKATDEITFNIGANAPKKTVVGTNSPCAGSVQTYTIPSTVGNTYAWQVFTGGTVTGASNSNTVNVEWNNIAGGPHLVVVNETDANGCTDRKSVV